MKNEEIRKQARNNGICLYEIAKKFKMQDSNFSRLLREELPEDKKSKVLQVIQEILKERE